MSETQNPLRRLKDFGQSVWLDYIRRDLLPSPDFRRMIDEDGLDGMTSNPTIFDKAIEGAKDYDKELTELCAPGKSIDDIYEALTTEDIKAAADKLRPDLRCERGPHRLRQLRGVAAARARYRRHDRGGSSLFQNDRSP